MRKFFLSLVYLFPSSLIVFLLNFFCKIRFFFISPYSSGVLYKSSIANINYNILVSSKDFGVGGSFAVFGEYQREKISDILSSVENVKSIVFLGVHVGSFLIPISKYILNKNNRSKKKITIDCYDANEKNIEFLKSNLKINDLGNHVDVYNYALGDKNKDVDFLLNSCNDGGSKIFPKKQKYIYFSDKPTVKKVKMIRLDEHKKTSKYDFIVMDLEGYEYLAMQGMQNKLKHSKFLQIEYNLKTILDVIGEIDIQKMIENLIDLGFCYLKIIGEKQGKIYKKEEFLSFFEFLNKKNKFVDILFYK